MTLGGGVPPMFVFEESRRMLRGVSWPVAGVSSGVAATQAGCYPICSRAGECCEVARMAVGLLRIKYVQRVYAPAIADDEGS